MGRARNPKRDKAYELWAESDGKRKLADIAAELDIPESRIRKWKSEDKWAQQIKERNKKERSEKTLRKKGAPKGNKNAKGKHKNLNGAVGGPEGNTYALKHGGYSSIYWDTLSDDEKQFLEEREQSEEDVLQRTIDLCEIREIRLQKAISKYEKIEFKNESKSGLAVSGVSTYQTTRKFSNSDEKERYEELKAEKIEEGKISYLGQEQNVQTNTEATYNIIARLQAELTRVQKQKTQCIRELAEIHERKTGGDNKNSIAKAWIAAVEKVSKNDG